jgi:hypothetical protein
MSVSWIRAWWLVQPRPTGLLMVALSGSFLPSRGFGELVLHGWNLIPWGFGAIGLDLYLDLGLSLLCFTVRGRVYCLFAG